MKKFFKSKITIGIGIALVLAVGGFLLFHHSVKYQFVPVTSGPIIETVSLTGNTTPLSSVSLSFNASGIISNIYSALGDKVSSGQILAEKTPAIFPRNWRRRRRPWTRNKRNCKGWKTVLGRKTSLRRRQVWTKPIRIWRICMVAL